MIAVTSSSASTLGRRAGWFTTAVSVTAPASPLATQRWRARLGRHARCLPTGHRLRPEVRVLSASRSAESAVAMIAVRAHDEVFQQVMVSLALVGDRWPVDSTTPTPAETR
ncbi:hypothetical protein ACFP3R_20330 [Saccharothrix lopnurensis]|uniref:Uncharacterized protein n=1 Tax=Saccharothrix lopnurensis TaxID=1670621 RepID=A0ABW1P945_9PSEU